MPSAAYNTTAASAPSRDPYKPPRANAADRQPPRLVHSTTYSKENYGSASRSASSSPTSSPKLDKREASAGTSTLLAQAPSRSNSLKRHSHHPSKPTFFTRLIHKLVSCVGLSTRAHDIDIDGVASSALGARKTAESEGKEFSEKVSEQRSRATVVPVAPLSEKGRPAAPPKDIPPISVTSGSVQPPGSSCPIPGSGSSDDSVDSGNDVQVPEEIFDDNDMMLIRNGGAGIPIGPDGAPRPLLPPISQKHTGKKCLVLDLDETLVHSNFRPIPDPDFIVPVEIENHWHNMYVQKRPGVDEFLRQMGQLYEVVVYTASLSAYADPVMDHLDMYGAVSHRLFRENCYRFKGNFVKDLSQLGRPMEETIIIDNSPASYIFHPANAVPISSWFNDLHDNELMDLCPFLIDLVETKDVRVALNPSM